MWLHRLVAASVQSTDTPEFAKTQGHNSSHMHMQGGEGPPVVACHTDPTTCDQLAYSRLIIREALCHGGVGWLNYDRAFRQQAAVDHLCGGTHWNIAPRTAGINDAGACHWPRGSVLYAVQGRRSHSGAMCTPVHASPNDPDPHHYLTCPQTQIRHLHIIEQGSLHFPWKLYI